MTSTSKSESITININDCKPKFERKPFTEKETRILSKLRDIEKEICNECKSRNSGCFGECEFKVDINEVIAMVKGDL